MPGKRDVKSVKDSKTGKRNCYCFLFINYFICRHARFSFSFSACFENDDFNFKIFVYRTLILPMFSQCTVDMLVEKKLKQ